MTPLIPVSCHIVQTFAVPDSDKTTLATLRVHYAEIDDHKLIIEEAATAAVRYPPLKFTGGI